ncbi:MAG: hypothetical protein ACXWWN_04485 [Gemmatimonadales bacterium]
MPQSHLYDRFQVSASGTLLVLGTTIRIDPDSGEGSEISLNDNLGVGSTTVQPRLALRWRPGRRHELEGGYQWANRSGETVLQDTIVFRDTAYAAGLRVNSESGTSQMFLTYRYAFTAKEKTQIGAALGIGLIFLRQTIAATAGATAGGPDTAIVQFSREGNINGPNASIGGYGRFQLGERWYLESDLRAIYIKIDNIKAAVVELGLAGRYFLSNKVGLELGYGLGSYSVEIQGTNNFAGINRTGKIKYTVNGWRFGGVYAF